MLINDNRVFLYGFGDLIKYKMRPFHTPKRLLSPDLEEERKKEPQPTTKKIKE